MSRSKPAHSSTLVPFLVLPENRFAFEAVASIGEGKPRPVYLHGPSGVGKSHLARHAVRQFLTREPNARVQHLTAAEFAAEFSEASTNRTIPLFQSATRDFDLFVLEDLQVLDRRSETQEQLLALCNELTAAGCQIIWTSRHSPGDLGGFLKKLVSRFRAGVLAQLKPPGPDSRLRLLQHFAEMQELPLSGETAEVLAAGLAVSPRELWAVLTQLDAASRQQRRALDSEMVRRFLRQESAPPRARLDDICRAVARQFGISARQLRSRKQSRGVVLPRQCAMRLARQLSGRSLEQIGRYFGGRDHSTVIHACRRLEALLPHEADLRLNLSQIESALSAPDL
ncbi:MAG: DnaA ATPase domain-containing protein [Deltaproteobacteria bacterium]